MVSGSIKSPKKSNSKMQPAKRQTKAGNKRALDESEEDESSDEVSMEMLKKLSKKMKPTEGSETDEENDDSDEESDDQESDLEDDDESECDENEDSEEEQEEDEENDDESDSETPSIPKMKSQPVKQQTSAPQKATNANQKSPTHPNLVDVESNAVVIYNLDKHLIASNLANFIGEKAGVKDVTCFISNKPSAVIKTKNKKDAEKILNSCQSVYYRGNSLQVATLSSGVIPQPAIANRSLKELTDMKPTKSMLVYSIVGVPDPKAISKLCPDAVDVNKHSQGVFVSFNDENACRNAFINLAKLKQVNDTSIFVKYVQHGLSSVFTGEETRFFIFNAPYKTRLSEIEELAPRASFVHFNPSTRGSWVLEFGNAKDCKEAGQRLHDYDFQGRRLRVTFINDDLWQIKLVSPTVQKLTNIHKQLESIFPEMLECIVTSTSLNGKRRPAIILKFKNRDSWLQAIAKAKKLKRLGSANVFMCNNDDATVDPSRRESQVAKTPQQKPQVAKTPTQKPKVVPVDEDENDDDSEEAMDDDDASSEDAMGDDDSNNDSEDASDAQEDADDGSECEEESESDDEFEKVNTPMNGTPHKKGGNRGGSQSHNKRGRGGNFNRGGRGNFTPSRGGRGNFSRGRGGRGKK